MCLFSEAFFDISAGESIKSVALGLRILVGIILVGRVGVRLGLRVVRLAPLARRSSVRLAPLAFRGLAPEVPPEADGILKPPPHSTKHYERDPDRGTISFSLSTYVKHVFPSSFVVFCSFLVFVVFLFMLFYF